MSLHQHRPHPAVARRRAAGPVKVADQHPAATAAARFNTALAVGITRLVGSMWCAYAFAALALVSLPDAIRGGTAALVAWIAQTFLQLVLLAVIMVGQNVQAAAADARSQATYDDAEAILHGQDQVAMHLGKQDEVLTAIRDLLATTRNGNAEASP